MTNEEKAKEIAQAYEKYTEDCRLNLHLEGKSKVDVARETAYAAAIEMAEWKDEQFKAEKQVDSPIKWNKNTKDCKPKVNHSILMKTTHGIVEGEWQGEQWYQYRWAGIVRDSDVLSWIELFNLEMKGEQQ